MNTLYLYAGMFFLWASAGLVAGVLVWCGLELWWTLYKMFRSVPSLVRRVRQLQQLDKEQE